MLLPTAEGEGRRVVLLGGEAGSGKSRLVREFAAEAAQSGALVLHGACDAVVHAPYGPFSQALERLAAVLDEEELRSALGASGGELIRLLPSLGEQLAGLSPPVPADPDTERHRLHTAVTDLLERVGQRRPVVLVIEDVHWADASTLLLLRHVAQTAWAGRVLLFATFRDTEDEVPPALAQALADLRRSDDVVRMRLEGLSDLEVSGLQMDCPADSRRPSVCKIRLGARRGADEHKGQCASGQKPEPRPAMFASHIVVRHRPRG